jgi:cobalt-zinc-cadmium efflux system membrane fusion protein
MAKQRETNRQVAKEDYLSVCEQSRFEARRRRDKARSSRDFARRMVDVSRRKLRNLLGEFTELAAGRAEEPGTADELTQFYLISPLQGTVEERHVAPAQRLAAGTPAFVVANTDTLWVTADIRERDWQAVSSLREGDVVTVRIGALAGKPLEARVDFLGRSVDHETQAVPLIAVLDNAGHHVKPGMFAWVSLPAGKPREALAVPTAALQVHEGRTFVFVAEGPRTFRRADVVVGMQTPEWVAIEQGLAPGQLVVTAGAFVLKSELLLEREEE